MNQDAGENTVGDDEFAAWPELPSPDAPTSDDDQADQAESAASTASGDVHDPSGLIRLLNETLEDFDRRLLRVETDVGAAAQAGAEARPRALDPETVATWVEWLIDTYQPDDKIHPQWASVPGVHQELAARYARRGWPPTTPRPGPR